ncbi:glycosyltransferase [Microbacterium xylanilyticum]
MTVYIASEVRMHVGSDGVVRAKHSAAAHGAWAPYVRAFGDVKILARVEDARSDEGLPVEGEGVRVVRLPYYAGLTHVPLGQLRVRRKLRSVGKAGDIFILRLPELMSIAAAVRAKSIGATIVSLLVADPRDMGRTLPRPLSLLSGRVLWVLASRIIRSSRGVVYVSQRYLQEVCPPPPGAAVLARSNVILGDSWLQKTGRTAPPTSQWRLVTVGTLEHRAKGMDFLIDVVIEGRRRGMDVSLTIVGSGRTLPALRERAAGVGEAIRFTGQIHDREELASLLDASDVYVSGSRSEGLPRATVEAMARGLPVITTDAGASRELVAPGAVVAVDDRRAFLAVLERLMSDDVWYRALSAENLVMAKEVARLAAPERLTDFLRAFGAQETAHSRLDIR